MNEIRDFGQRSFVRTTGLIERIEKMNEQELLAVLDMSEEKQIMWSLVHTDMREPESLADLAFRLRDEVIAKDDESEIDCNWCEASYEVYLYIIGEENEMEAKEGLDTWFTMRAKPIHWIIAALIAKESK